MADQCTNLNPIICLKYLESVIQKTVFLTDGTNLDTIEGLKTVRNSYINLIWLQTKLALLKPRLEDAIEKYKTITDIICKKVSDISNDLQALDTESTDVFSDWQSTGEAEIGLPPGLSWGEQEEYENLVKQVHSMKKIGYPNPDKVGAIIHTANMFSTSVAASPVMRMSSTGPIASPVMRVSSTELEEEFVSETKTDNPVRLVANHIVGSHIYSKNGVSLEIPIIDDIKNIPPIFYYYRGSTGKVRKHGQYQAGIYVRMSNGSVAMVPNDLEVVADVSEGARRGTSKCKNPKCIPYKCTYAHAGSNYKKLGTSARCPGCPRFGNTETIDHDCVIATHHDIRMVMMYGLNDLFASALWIEKNRFMGNFEDLDLVS